MNGTLPLRPFLPALLVASLAIAQGRALGADTAGGGPAVIPLSLKGPGSLTGVWTRTGPALQSAGGQPAITTADGKPIPYQPKIAQQLAQEQKTGPKPIDARSAPWCMPAGLPVMMSPDPDLPLEILETPRQVTVLFGNFGTFRLIHMNAKHPEDPDPGYFGNSVAHWEGNTLVVDTTALLEKTTVFGAPHSEDMHLVERLQRIDESTLENRITVTDPATYTRPWTWVITLKRVPGARVREYERRPC